LKGIGKGSFQGEWPTRDQALTSKKQTEEENFGRSVVRSVKQSNKGEGTQDGLGVIIKKEGRPKETNEGEKKFDVRAE